MTWLHVKVMRLRAGGGALTGAKTRAVIASLRMPARDIVQRMKDKPSWRTRVLWGLGWGHMFLPSTLYRESTLDRIGQAASDLADDIEAAVS